MQQLGQDSWQNDWSQGFWLCDQEELPYCDTCVKVPYQSHIWYSECGSIAAVPATHYCWVLMCLSMSHVFILQRYLRLLASCCNSTTKCHTGMGTTFKYSNPPGCQIHMWWRCSDLQDSMTNWADLWVTLWKVYWVCIKRNMTTQCPVWWLPRWSFRRRQFSSEMEEIIRQLLFLFERGNLGTLLKNDFLSVKVNQWRYFLGGWWNNGTYWVFWDGGGIQNFSPCHWVVSTGFRVFSIAIHF